MKIRLTFVLTLCFSLMGTMIVLAQTEKTQPGTHTPGVTTRQHVQAKRVRRGVRSKELTKHETGALVKDAREIQQQKANARADGTVTGAERKEIHQDMNQTSRKIYRKKHNNRTRK